MYNILNIPVSTLTNIIYKTFYQNKDIMDVFDNFKNITNAGIDLWSNDCKIYPNINNEDINISIDYYKIFKEEE